MATMTARVMTRLCSSRVTSGAFGQESLREGCQVVVNAAELVLRREEHDAEEAIACRKAEAGSVHAQDAGLAQESEHEVLVRLSGWERDLRHHVERRLRRNAFDSRNRR